jgi:dipeptidyl-peptidase-4
VATEQLSFPRLNARTQRFTLGAPRNFAMASDGSIVTFLRSKGPEDPVTCLWALDVETGVERLVADPAVLLAEGNDADLPAAERARRERAREGAGGIVGYGADRSGLSLSYALAGRALLTTIGVSDTETVGLATTGPVFDPRPSPDGKRVAYVSGNDLRMVGPGIPDGAIVQSESSTVSWGSAEFIAAEEMRRSRGYWWSPGSDALLVARVDVEPVNTWYIADPAQPGKEPQSVRYPAAGTANADVALFVVALDGERREVHWDRSAFEYLLDVSWSDSGAYLVVQSRDQRRVQLLEVDPSSGETNLLSERQDPYWVEVVPGSPTLIDGEPLWVAESGGSRALLLGDEVVSPADHWVRGVVSAQTDEIVWTASVTPEEVHVYRRRSGFVEQMTTEVGVHSAVGGGEHGVFVISAAPLVGPPRSEVRAGEHVWPIASLAASPPFDPQVTLMTVGERSIPIAVLFPSEVDDDSSGPLPVLLDPYGGPHAQRVLAARNGFLASQWFADQGFVVIVADGRGTPGRGGGWEQAVAGDLAAPVLEDQVTALQSVAQAYPGRLDLDRVAVRGWSFGGYLAALAVLRRPDVFHAAVAGAPVTDWALYDTHYTERYLGRPGDEPEAYRRTSLIEDAHLLERPLLLVHGLADDNVVAAHTLQLSTALLAAGRPHEVLPLSGVTHMTPQEIVAENLLLLQVEFLRRSLGPQQRRVS